MSLLENSIIVCSQWTRMLILHILKYPDILSTNMSRLDFDSLHNYFRLDVFLQTAKYQITISLNFSLN